MKIYLINLDRSEERLTWFTESTSGLEVDIVRVSAVDGGLMPDTDRQTMLGKRSGRYQLGNGEVGCFLSHRKAWQYIAGADDSWAFVAEDDLHLSQTAGGFFSESAWIPHDAELIKAETHLQPAGLARRPAGAAFGHDIRLLRSNHRGSAGYFVHKAAAARLLRLTENMCDPLDEVLFNPELGVAGIFVTYQIDPAIGIQDFLLSAGNRQRFVSTLEAGRGKPLISIAKKRSRGFKLQREALRIAGHVQTVIRDIRQGVVRKKVPFKS